MSIIELAWFKSSYSGTEGDNCVEVAVSPATVVHIRDSKDTVLPHLSVSPDAWTNFLAHTDR